MIKKIIIGAAITAAMVVIPAPANARQSAENDGNEWLAACDSDSHGEIMWCLGYTQSMEHTVTTLSEMTEKTYYCNTRALTMGQIRDIMRSYLYRKPAKRSDPMMLIFINSLQEAFPCK